MLKLNVLACFYMSSGKKESYKMNSFNIDNSNIKISTGVNSGLKANAADHGGKAAGRVGFGVALAGDGHAAAHGLCPQIAVPLAGHRG